MNKRILALSLALLIALSISVTAFAAPASEIVPETGGARASIPSSSRQGGIQPFSYEYFNIYNITSGGEVYQQAHRSEPGMYDIPVDVFQLQPVGQKVYIRLYKTKSTASPMTDTRWWDAGEYFEWLQMDSAYVNYNGTCYIRFYAPASNSKTVTLLSGTLVV